MRKIKVGDRVRIYNSLRSIVGRVYEITDLGLLRVRYDSRSDDGYSRGVAHPKQCRRLLPKKREPSPPTDRVQYKFGPITGTGTIKAVPSIERSSLGRKSEESVGGESYGADKPLGRVSYPMCGDHLKESGLDWDMDDLTSMNKCPKCNPPAYDRSQVEKAKRPKAREWWIETTSDGEFQYWETNISTDKNLECDSKWVKVQEVLE